MGKDGECILAPNNWEHKTKHSFFMNAKDIMGQIKLRLEIKKQKEWAKIKVISKGKLKPLKSILVKKNSNELEHKESGNVSVKTGCIKRVMINEVTKWTSFNQESFRLHKKNTKFVRYMFCKSISHHYIIEIFQLTRGSQFQLLILWSKKEEIFDQVLSL